MSSSTKDSHSASAPSFHWAYSLLEQGALSPAQIGEAMTAIFRGLWNSTQVAVFAAGLRRQALSPETLAAAASAMRDVMVPVEHGLREVVDTCGTGGDGTDSLNISTAAAIVVAAAGVYVAKHGNRAVSSRCGSADVVEALGIPLGLEPTAQATVLKQAHIAFLMAPTHHPAMKHVAQARRELGIRTIFNTLGPLVNPARATHQLVGVYHADLCLTVATALNHLGVKRAWVVSSADGHDEISANSVTTVGVLEDGEVSLRTVSPQSFGRSALSTSATVSSMSGGGDARSNAEALLRIFQGEEHAAVPAIVMNAAATLALVRNAPLDRCAEEAREVLTSKRAYETLEVWRTVAHAQASESVPASEQPERSGPQ